jgi:hypothetical protein
VYAEGIVVASGRWYFGPTVQPLITIAISIASSAGKAMTWQVLAKKRTGC